jgi:hypothetical protein
VSFDITTEKCRLIRIKNIKANRNKVETVETAPIRWDTHFNRSNQTIRIKMPSHVANQS